MTTLSAFGGRPKLCFPKPEHYRFLFILLVALCSNNLTALAQDTLRTDAIVKISIDSIPDTIVVADCNLDIRFQSDMTEGIQYSDSLGKPRNSLITFCPPNGNSNLIFTFEDLGLAPGDNLYAYEGFVTHTMLDDPTIPIVPTGSGSTVPDPKIILIGSNDAAGGASSFNGGWTAANCDRAQNATGCVTFHFTTNGDRKKDIGWNSKLSCQDRTTKIIPPENQFVSLDCQELKRWVGIETGTIESVCDISNDSITIQILNGAGTICKDTCLKAGDNFTIDTLAIGTYTIKYSLKIDPEITAESYLAISPPVMVCNDDVNVSLGSGCGAKVTPDMLLENPCEVASGLITGSGSTIGTSISYEIIVRRENGSIIAEGSTATGYPEIHKDSIDVCGDTKYEVEIKRIYDYQDGCCSQGPIEDICWGYMHFIDETGPAFTEIKTDTLKVCTVSLDYLNQILEKPTIIDNCDSATVELYDIELVSGTECDSISTYLAKWRAEDFCGNQTLRSDTLRILRPTAEDFIKLDDIILSCGVDTEAAINDVSKTGIPQLVFSNDTITLNTEDYTCSYILFKEDQYFPHPGGVKLFRYWSFADRCSPRPIPIRIDTQLIEFVDTLLPTLVCPPHNSLADAEKFPLDPFECTLGVSIETPTATDLCDPSPTVKMNRVEQLVHGTWDSIAPNLSVAGTLMADTFRVGWEAYDETGNRATNICYRYFILEDLTPPSAICKDELHISYGDGENTLTIDEIDEISWDACGIADRKVRRTDEGVWRDFVDFSCEDVFDPVRVELQVTDFSGNNNVCWLFVNVLDNVRPICETLPDTIAYCDEFFSKELGEPTDADGDNQLEDGEWQPLTGDLLALYETRFGQPSCSDNAVCRTLSIEQEYQLIYSQCGEASVRRRYRAFDANQEGQVSPWQMQIITVAYRPDWSFTLPVDWAGECGDAVPAAGMTITRGACDVLAWEYEDQVFDIVSDACFQVNRTYYIINWCTYQPGSEPVDITRSENVLGEVREERVIDPSVYGNLGYFKYTQVLKISDNNKPVVTINPVQTCIYGAGDVAPFGTEDITLGSGPYECDTVRVFTAEATDCEDAFFKNFSFEYWISEDGVEVGHGDSEKFFWTVQPKVEYTVRFRVYDNCGNFGDQERTFEFWDCRPPTVICQDTLTTSIRDVGTALVSPAIIAGNSFDNCLAPQAMDYRIWHSSFSAEAPEDLEGIIQLPNALELGCDYRSLQTVQVFVLDGEQNYGSCETRVIIDDANNACESDITKPRVAGKITMPDGEAIQEVEVSVAGAGTMPAPYMTSENGDYAFELNDGAAYQLIPAKDNNPLNGVSTFDLVLISKHILGIQYIPSPYHIIAADINRSGTITAFDMVQLRRLILNITTEFPDNKSWRFVDASYQFTSADPLTEAFNETIVVDVNGVDQMNNNFIAIKVGDVSGNASANELVTAEARTSSDRVSITIENKIVKVGQEITVDFTIPADQELDGYQFALAYQDLSLVEMQEGLVKETNIGWTMKDRNVLPISWNKVGDQSFESNQFTLTFKAEKTAALSELLMIQPRVMEAEAYTTEREIKQIELAFTAIAAPFEVQQNRPNPFTTQTTIGFQLPEADMVSLTILTPDGKEVKKWSQYFDKGYNEWNIQSHELSEKGILYYKIQSKDQVQTKKMILL